jgi:hypothetical protein
VKEDWDLDKKSWKENSRKEKIYRHETVGGIEREHESNE